jgi:hypothetical protein
LDSGSLLQGANGAECVLFGKQRTANRAGSFGWGSGHRSSSLTGSYAIWLQSLAEKSLVIGGFARGRSGVVASFRSDCYAALDKTTGETVAAGESAVLPPA